MRIRSLAIIALLAAMVMVTGCRTAPVYNVDNAPVTSTTGKVAKDDVRNAILQSGAALGWRMNEAEPGHIVGTLNLRQHMAQVDIVYTAKAYSIRYKNSSNLKYDGTSIHSNYNGWVQNLDRSIQSRLVAM